MKFLPLDTIKLLHTQLIRNFGGIDGIRDEGLLDSAIAYPRMLHEMGNEQDVFKIAAAYCSHIIKNHPALDGNKRLAVLAMLVFLKLNGKNLHIPQEELYELAINAATSQIDENKITLQLHKNQKS